MNITNTVGIASFAPKTTSSAAAQSVNSNNTDDRELIVCLKRQEALLDDVFAVLDALGARINPIMTPDTPAACDPSQSETHTELGNVLEKNNKRISQISWTVRNYIGRIQI